MAVKLKFLVRKEKNVIKSVPLLLIFLSCHCTIKKSLAYISTAWHYYKNSGSGFVKEMLVEGKDLDKQEGNV